MKTENMEIRKKKQRHHTEKEGERRPPWRRTRIKETFAKGRVEDEAARKGEKSRRQRCKSGKS